MKPTSPSRSVRGCSVALLVGLGGLAIADDAAVTTAAEAPLRGGEKIYRHICQGCHMADAGGASGAGRYPKLAGDPALASRQYVALTILNGRGAMPPFGVLAEREMARFSTHLTDTEVADVINFVRSNFGNHYRDAITPQQVAALPHTGAARR